ncbi:hypothetical protein GF314_07585 [bacterium]|nr:hypothetical protein [bacterium]
MDAAPGAFAGPSAWQIVAALATVLGLLILALKLVRRLGWGGGDAASVRLRQVRKLGPRREIEAIELDGEVHTIYRRDGGLVVLRTEPAASWESRQAGAPPAPGAGVGRTLKALAAAAGGMARREPTP